MVREIICLQVGQAGNQVGSRFWEAVFAEHKLDKKGREKAKFDPDVHGDKIDVYFKEQNGRGPDHNREYKSKSSGKWIPRAVMVDLEPGTLDVVTASAVGAAFKPDNFVFGNSVPVTTGPRATTPRAPRSSSRPLMSSVRRLRAPTTFRASRSRTPSAEVPDLDSELCSS